MYKARDDVRIFEVAGALSQHDDPHPCRTIASQVIVPSEDVRRDRGCEVVAELILVSTCDTDLAEQGRCLSSPPTDFEYPPSSSRVHSRSYFREAARDGSWSRPKDM